MTTLLTGGPLGAQTPNELWVPEAPTSAGAECLELAAESGMDLDPWQQLVLDLSLRESAAGLWAAFEVGLLVARQNGKGEVVEARELSGLFLFGERLIIHSAHLFETAADAFRRMCERIEANPDLDRRVERVNRSHGEEGIEIRRKRGAPISRIRYRTRSKGSGRGLSGDLVVLDEAMITAAHQVGALLPVMSARPNPQLWYVGSAVDELVHDGEVFTRVRARALAGGQESLAWFGWTNPEGADPRDMRAVAQANPALGRRITHDYIAKEQRGMPAREHAVERMSQGFWPDLDAVDTPVRVLDLDVWRSLVCDRDTLVLVGPVAIAFDMDPARRWLTIAAARHTADGRVHVEVGHHSAPSRGAVRLLVDLVTRWDPCALVVDAASPAASLIPDLAAAGIEPETTTGRLMAQAWGGFSDDAAAGAPALSHTGDPLLADAWEAATERDMPGGGKALNRTGAGVISPGVAVVLARWGLKVFGAAPKAPDQAPVQDRAAGVPAALDGSRQLMTAGF